MDESAQHKLDRLRPPRVQVTVDLEAGEVIVEKELPFKVGFVSDREGWVSARTTPHLVEPLSKLREARFIERKKWTYG